MNFDPIIIVWGEPNSIFTEIFLKSLKKYNSKKPLILIGSFELFKDQIKKLKISFNLNLVNLIKNDLNNLSKKKLNFINVSYNYKKPFEKISLKSNNYLSNCFNLAFQINKNHNISGLINGPISKNIF